LHRELCRSKQRELQPRKEPILITRKEIEEAHGEVGGRNPSQKKKRMFFVNEEGGGAMGMVNDSATSTALLLIVEGTNVAEIYEVEQQRGNVPIGRSRADR
jgi:hypothetical protein